MPPAPVRPIVVLSNRRRKNLSTHIVAGVAKRLSFFILPIVLCALSAPRLEAHGTHTDLMALVDAELAKQPENGELWYKRALLDFEHEDWAETLLDLENAEQFAPDKFPTLWFKGQVQDAEGKSAEAKATLDTFLEKSPTHWGGLASRARVETKLGLHEKALADFRAALANHPQAEPDLVQEVAQALADNGLDGEAVQVLEAGLGRLGPIPSLQLRTIAIETNAGRYDAALARVELIVKTAPRPEPWMVRRASLLAEAGRLPESRSAWQLLVDHLQNLPASERESHAMTLLSEQARQALVVLAAPSPSSPFSKLPARKTP